MPRPRTDTNPPTTQVLDKALRVLESFDAQQAPEWSEVDLRRHLDLPSTTLNRILRSLESAGYVLRDGAGRYRLGLAAVRLGRNANASAILPAALDSPLRELARATDELVLLAIPDFENAEARYVTSIDSSKRLRVTADVGTIVPLTAGATARAILAFQPEDRVEEILRRSPQQLANGTLTDPKRVRAELERTREQGWSRSWEETYDGAWALGAPVLDPDREAVAGIGVAIPTTRHTEQLEKTIRKSLLAAARDAAARLNPQ